MQHGHGVMIIGTAAAAAIQASGTNFLDGHQLRGHDGHCGHHGTVTLAQLSIHSDQAPGAVIL